MKKAMLCLLMILSVFLLAACQKQPQPEIKLPEPQAAASPAQPGPETVEQTLTLGLIDFDADKELLRGLIQSYNASGAPVRIEIVNYADGAESYADAVTRRTTELMAGNVPDLLDCSDLSGAQYAGNAKNGIRCRWTGCRRKGCCLACSSPARWVGSAIPSSARSRSTRCSAPRPSSARRCRPRSRMCCAARSRMSASSGAAGTCSASIAATPRSAFWTTIPVQLRLKAKHFWTF